jgi:hypothetical protein
MITRSQNAACLAVAEEADKVPAWKNYAQYCRLREQGLRKQAFARMDLFIAQAVKWGFAYGSQNKVSSLLGPFWL